MRHGASHHPAIAEEGGDQTRVALNADRTLTAPLNIDPVARDEALNALSAVHALA